MHNVAGTPAMSVPLHWTAEGLPIGAQFAAGRGREAMLLALAYELESAKPWIDRHPPVFAGQQRVARPIRFTAPSSRTRCSTPTARSAAGG
ncbi:MAG: amidase family protein [Alphaproteobacteria bacterium]